MRERGRDDDACGVVLYYYTRDKKLAPPHPPRYYMHTRTSIVGFALLCISRILSNE